MLIRKKLPAIILCLVIIAMAFWGYKIYKSRNSVPAENKTAAGPAEVASDSPATPFSTDDLQNDQDADNSQPAKQDDTGDDTDENTPDEKNSFLDLSPADCTNECKDFSKSEEKKYCQEVCGISPVKKDIPEKTGCDKLTDLEKDYCLKDLAVSNQDLNICTQISDTAIEKSCRDQLGQELINIRQ